MCVYFMFFFQHFIYKNLNTSMPQYIYVFAYFNISTFYFSSVFFSADASIHPSIQASFNPCIVSIYFNYLDIIIFTTTPSLSSVLWQLWCTKIRFSRWFIPAQFFHCNCRPNTAKDNAEVHDPCEAFGVVFSQTAHFQCRLQHGGWKAATFTET